MRELQIINDVQICNPPYHLLCFLSFQNNFSHFIYFLPLRDAWIIITQMMKALLRSPRFFMARFKQTNKDVGLLGQEPDLQGKEYDKFRRFYTRVHLQHAGQQMPNFLAHPDDLPTLERNQIETRILRIVRDLEIINLRELRFDADLRSDLKIDSLNLVALLTSIEHEFTTVFEDNVFEGIASLDEVVTILMRDPKII